MEFWLVVELMLGVVLAWAAISDRRDRRYHHLRSHSEMADDHREHLHDVRAADMGSHLNPDTSWMHRPGSSHQPRRPSDDAASQPKEVRWYEAGHFLNCTAREDMMAWLARHIRIDPARSTCPP